MLLATPVTETCIYENAEKYNVPIYAVTLIMAQESGRVGKYSVNKNGSIDIGVMQINWRVWGQELEQLSITRRQLLWNGCLNVEVGTWILAKAIVETRAKHRNDWTIWHAVARYHSKTPYYQRRYLSGIRRNYFALVKDENPLGKLVANANSYLLSASKSGSYKRKD